MRPILKYSGGKSKLLPEIRRRLPSSWRRYYEPFLGGGALFFDLEHGQPCPVVGDVNPLVVDTYRAVADHLDDVVALLREHKTRYETVDKYYYEVRDKLNDGTLHTTAERGAGFLFLNKTCYNGLVRVNKNGKFNVPEGDYKRPAILDEPLLREASGVLQRADLRRCSYEETTACAEVGDLVYLDPPYDPASPTSNFTAYAAAGFSSDDQRLLAGRAREIAERGAYVILSNNDTPLVRTLYDGWRIEVVRCGRSINSRADRRGAVDEVLIMSNNFSSRGEAV